MAAPERDTDIVANPIFEIAENRCWVYDGNYGLYAECLTPPVLPQDWES